MRISTKTVTNFDASASTGPTQRHHEVHDHWLLMQEPKSRTKVQDNSAENGSVRTDRTCISRKRDIVWISWNIGSKLVFVRFFHNVKSTFCTVSRGFKLGIAYHSTEKHDGRTVPKVRVLCQSLFVTHLLAVPRSDTNVSSCRTQRDSI